MKAKTLLLMAILASGVALCLVLLYRSDRGRNLEPTDLAKNPSSLPTAAKQNPRTPTLNQNPILTETAPTLTVPDTIRPIVDLNGDGFQRLKAVRAVNWAISRDERDALYAFLRERHIEDDGQPGHVLKNEVMDILCTQTPLPAGLGQLLADVYRDRNQNVVVRDYAVQHLIPLYANLENSNSAARDLVNSNKELIRQILWEATAETGESLAGTALLGLSRLADTHAELDQGQIVATALRFVHDPSVGELTRITALQVCARMQVKESLPVLIEAAETGATAPLKISAIGAIGSMGTQSETELLQRIIGSGDERLKPAATSALRRIQGRVALQTGSLNQNLQ